MHARLAATATRRRLAALVLGLVVGLAPVPLLAQGLQIPTPNAGLMPNPTAGKPLPV